MNCSVAVNEQISESMEDHHYHITSAYFIQSVVQARFFSLATPKLMSHQANLSPELNNSFKASLSATQK